MNHDVKSTLHKMYTVQADEPELKNELKKIAKLPTSR